MLLFIDEFIKFFSDKLNNFNDSKKFSPKPKLFKILLLFKEIKEFILFKFELLIFSSSYIFKYL